MQPGSMRLQPGCAGLRHGSMRLQLGWRRKSRTTRCGGRCLLCGPRCVSGASGASRGLADTGAPAGSRPASRPARSQAGQVSEGDRSPPAPRPWAGCHRAARTPRAPRLAPPRAPEKTSELSTPAAGHDGPRLGAGACRGPRLRSLHARSCPRPAARRRARPRGGLPCARACRAWLAARSPRRAPSWPPPPRLPPPASEPSSRSCAASYRAPAACSARAAPPHAT